MADSICVQVGGEPTFAAMSQRFHDRLEHDPALREIFPKDMHALTERLALFLTEEFGGPPVYTAKRGKTSQICRHAHLVIGPAERDAWLGHMFAVIEDLQITDPAREAIRGRLTEIAGTLADPFLDYYGLALDELRARLQADPSLASRTDHGRSLLAEAAQRWDVPRTDLLLEFGASPTTPDLLEHTALHKAANAQHMGRESEGVDTVRQLLAAGAQVNEPAGPGRQTPLHMAARRGTIPIGEALLCGGAEIEAKDSKGETPLRRAVNCSRLEFARFLCENGADPLARDSKGRTPLDAARTEPMRELLSAFVQRS